MFCFRSGVRPDAVCCSLVRPTFVKNVGPDGVLRKFFAEPIIMVSLEWLLRILWMIMYRIMCGIFVCMCGGFG